MKIFPECYPAGLNDLSEPVEALYAQGNVELLHKKGVCIVGTRNPTAYGRRQCTMIVEKLRSHDIVIVSGFALGVDACAHEAAIKHGIPSIAVLGSSLESDYPKRNRELRARMLAAGHLFITEFAPGSAVRPENFPRRNRILAALCEDVIIIQSSVRSGTMNTASHALTLGRNLWVLPGNIDEPMSRGPNWLIFQGASPLYDIEEQL
jgi:DNA processing protein